MQDHAVADGDETRVGQVRAMHHDQIRFDEMRHRYANAVQLAMGTLAYEARHCVDARAKQVLDGAAGRLAVLRHLYLMMDENAADEPLSTGAFLHGFCTYLRTAYFTSADFTCTAECDDVELAAETCRLLCRAVHELVVNAVKHAFANRSRGRVTISLRHTTAGVWRCSVEDDGIGLGGTASGKGGRGRNLVVALARQMGGQAIWESRQAGSAVHLLIPIDQSRAARPLPA